MTGLLAVDRRDVADRLRATYDRVQVSDPVWSQERGGAAWEWSVAAGDLTFTSRLRIERSASSVVSPSTRSLVRALAAIDSLSYWKAFAAPLLTMDFVLPGDAGWWDAVVRDGMSEFLWTNGLTPEWLPHLDCAGFEGPVETPEQQAAGQVGLLHSGGKDSIAASWILAEAGMSIAPITYRPTPEAVAVVAAGAPRGGWAGPPVHVHRDLDHRLLDLNARGFLNGHTPYSAWLALAGAVVADDLGLGRIAAGNSRSDDEDNIVGSWNGAPWAINHQWSKSAAFEALWADFCPAVAYASPLRPLHELAVVGGLLAIDPPGFDSALSCNRAAKAGHPGDWCGRCPKCVWMALAVAALSSREVATARLGCDPLDDPRNVDLLASMTGRRGVVPFECAGLPVEVLACVDELIERHARPPAAIAALVEAGLTDRGGPGLKELVTDLGPAPFLSETELLAVAQWLPTV